MEKIMPRKARDVRTRIMESIEIDAATQCWNWKGRAKTGSCGYASITLPSKTNPRAGTKLTAHRVAYEYFIGDIPPGLIVMHRCDNVKCVNPDHLSLGTNKMNTQDMMRKGRHRIRRGSEHGMAILTEEAVRHIRAAFDGSTETRRALALQYGVDIETIGAVLRRENWKHLP
jgi:hypothetical protein